MKAIQARLSKKKDRKQLGIEYIIFPTPLQSVVENIMTWLDIGSRDFTLKSVNYPKTKGMKTIEMEDGTVYEEVEFMVSGRDENNKLVFSIQDASDNVHNILCKDIYRIF